MNICGERDKNRWDVHGFLPVSGGPYGLFDFKVNTYGVKYEKLY